MRKLTTQETESLWNMLSGNTEQKICHKLSAATNGRISYDDFLFNAGIGEDMFRAAKRLMESGVNGDNVNPNGYVYTAGLNRGRDYQLRRIEELKKTINTDEVAERIKGDSGGEVDFYDINNIDTNIAEDPEQSAITKIDRASQRERIKAHCEANGLTYKDGITIDELKEQRDRQTGKETEPKPKTLTDNIREALAVGCETRKEVISYLNSIGAKFSNPSVVAVYMSTIRNIDGTGKKQTDAIVKAADIFHQNINVSFSEFCDKLGDICAPSTKKAYYQEMKAKMVRPQNNKARILNSRGGNLYAKMEKIFNANPEIGFDEFHKKAGKGTRATLQVYYRRLKKSFKLRNGYLLEA